MIAKVLQDLIDAYNEIGIFIINKKTIYWFNGKNKLINWCEIPIKTSLFKRNDCIYIIKKILYLQISVWPNDALYIFVNEKWQQIYKKPKLKLDEINNYISDLNTYTFLFNSEIYKITQNGIYLVDILDFRKNKLLIPLPKDFDISRAISTS